MNNGEHDIRSNGVVINSYRESDIVVIPILKSYGPFYRPKRAKSYGQ